MLIFTFNVWCHVIVSFSVWYIFIFSCTLFTLNFYLFVSVYFDLHSKVSCLVDYWSNIELEDGLHACMEEII